MNLSILGQELEKIGNLDDKAFRMLLSTISSATQARIATFVERKLDEQPQAPIYWRDAVSAFLASLRQVGINNGIPVDIPGSAQERLLQFKSLIANYGALLHHWPAMWQACAGDERHTLSQIALAS